MKTDKKRKVMKVAKIPNWKQKGNIYSSEGISPTLCATNYKGPIKIREREREQWILVSQY